MKTLALILLLCGAAIATPSYTMFSLPLLPSIAPFANPGLAGTTEVCVWSDDPTVTGFTVTVALADGSTLTQTVNIDPSLPSTIAWFPVPAVVGNPQIIELH